jgi:hypothetical protein
MTKGQPALPGGRSMLGRSLLKVIIPAALLLCASTALAENRLALVIGQSAYKTVPVLPNPGNDAKAMAQLLTDSGFEVVSATDLSQNQMREKVSEFAGRIAAKGADTVAMIFYAGHGLQIDGENFLVPVDVDVKRGLQCRARCACCCSTLAATTRSPS